MDYAYPWDGLITEFKFHENPSWARHFATLMRSAPWVDLALEKADIVIPIPLATERMLERGFNQSALLTRHLCPAKNREDVLLRVINTPAQSTLDRDARQHNVRRAFTVEPSRRNDMTGKRIVLVDDVMTSGASMGAATSALKHAGAIHITAIVFARTATEPSAA